MSIRIHRRDFLKTGLSAGGAIVLAPLALPVRAASSATGRASIGTLATALRSIGGDVCIDAATRLKTLPANSDTFSLHLRHAGLRGADAAVLAEALRSLPNGEIARLTSFSLSYNPDIGDTGASLIANSLPISLPELGMVGCNIGDTGGETLLRWAHQASSLHTMCIERNRFSDGLKARFDDFARQKPNLLLMV